MTARLDGLHPIERAWLDHKARQAGGAGVVLREIVRFLRALDRASRLALARGRADPRARAAERRVFALPFMRWAERDEAALAEARARLDHVEPGPGTPGSALLALFLLPEPDEAGGRRRPHLPSRMVKASRHLAPMAS